MLGLAPMVALAADFALPSVALLFLPLLAVHRGGRQAIAKEHQAVHDALTGLPNRSLFRHQIEQVVNAGRRTDRTAAVMLIDLDHFKEINDTLGHHAGDRLLQEVSERLRASLEEHQMVARLGGDEFGVLIPDLPTHDEASAVAQRLLTQLREPFSIEGLTLEVDASIGIACAPEHGSAVEQLIQRADIAMYAAKEGGPRPPAVRAAARPLQPAPPVARRRAALGDRRRRDRPLLPAEGRAHHRQDHRRRGPGPLAAPAARPDRPVRVRADRRADRPDRPAHLARARGGAAPGRASGPTTARS